MKILVLKCLNKYIILKKFFLFILNKNLICDNLKYVLKFFSDYDYKL